MKHLTAINRKAARVETVTARDATKDVVALQGPPQQPEPRWPTTVFIFALL